MFTAIMNFFGRKWVYPIAVALIIVSSFSLYAYVRYPALNSDHAVTVLMAHSFSLPHDFYYWGQDRYGSIVPLLAQLPMAAGIHAYWAVSITHYFILAAGFFSIASFFRLPFFKILLCIVWFLPPTRMLDVVQFWSGLEYSFLFISCYLIKRAEGFQLHGNKSKTLWYWAGSAVSLLVAFWVADLAMVSIAVLLSVLCFFHVRAQGFKWKHLVQPAMVIFLIAAAIGWLFITWAKSNADQHHQYVRLSDWEGIRNTFCTFFSTLVDIALFKAKEPFTSVYFYGVIVLLGLFRKHLRGILTFALENKWFLFLLLDAIAVFAIVISSQHVNDNLVQRRFFNCTYITLSISILMLIEHGLYSSWVGAKSMLMVAAFSIVTAGLGSYYHHACIWPRTLRPRVVQAQEMIHLGSIGLIGNYWNTYVYSSINPDSIKALPIYAPAVRDKQSASMVFSQPILYLVKDMWLEEFSDTLVVSERTLIKRGQSFHIGGCEICEYECVP